MRQTSRGVLPMNDNRSGMVGNLTRRHVLSMASAGVAAMTVGAGPLTAQRAPSPPRVGNQQYNILLILTDQERHFRPGELPADYSLPAHERLMRAGTTF